MSLTDIKIRNAKPGVKPDGTLTDKRYKLTDSKGLQLEVSPQGGKWWRFKYRIDGKEKRLSLGVYPDITLKEARERRDEFRKLVAKGIDPSDLRKAEKASQTGAESFESIAREWHTRFLNKWTEGHAQRILARLQNDVFPTLGKRKVNEITAPELLAVLRIVESRGAFETAHRINQICGQIFRYAISTGRAERDISSDLKGALTPTKVKHHSSITDLKMVGELLRAIDGYAGSDITGIALKLSALFFVRPGELRHAEWSEFSLQNQEWRIPAEKMKLRQMHIVPLSTQALTLLIELQKITGHTRYLFPSVRTISRPMSNNTVNAALRRIGYTKEEMTAHGFRSMASTILNEKGWNRDAIERQLAHAERDAVRASYNYAEYLDERRKMMQYWANLLDELRLKVSY